MVSVEERILSIDALKGFAACMIIVVHGIVFGIFTPDPSLFQELTNRVPLIFLILLSPIILMATWFPVFILLAGVTVTFSFIRESHKEDPDFGFVLKKKFVNAISLIILGSLYGPVLSHAGYTGTTELRYSVITGYIDTGNAVTLDTARFFEHTIFGAIGITIIILSLLFYLLFTRLSEKTSMNSLLKLMVILEIGTIVISFVLEGTVGNTDIYKRLESFSPILYDLTLRIFGERHSLLPQLFFGFSGACYGIIMASPITREDKHQLIRLYGWKKNVVIFGLFVIIMIITQFDYVAMITRENLSVLFQFGNLAMLNFVICIFFERFDFNSSYSKSLQESAFLRTFAPVTMTVYFLESLVASSLRWVFIKIFGPAIFPWNGLINVIYMVLILLFWYGVIKLWSRIRFQGSFEWIVVISMQLFGVKSNRLQSKFNN